MKILVYILITISIFSCTKESPTNQPIITISNVTDTMVVLNKWQILGPFPTESLQQLLDSNNLELFGMCEDSIRFEEFVKLTKHQAKDTSLLDTCFANRFYYSGLSPVDFGSVFKINNNKFFGNIYAGCMLNCKREIKTRLHFSSNASEKIWLNGKLICKDDRWKAMWSYQQFIPVTLKKGANFLLIKIGKFHDRWEMYARLENESKKAMKRYILLHNHAIVNDNIFTNDTMRLDNYFPPVNGRITVSDNTGKALFSDSIIPNKKWYRTINILKNGIYNAAFNTGKIALTQDFYRGNLHDTLPKLIRKIQSLQTFGRVKDNLDALIFRYNHLLNNTYPTDPKYVTLFIQLTNAYNDILKGVDPFHHTKGSFIRSYISDIDSSRQYYILHVPATYDKNKPSAVASNMPATIYDGLPYLQSFRVANSKLIDFFQDLSEKYNLIFVEPGSRRFKHPNFNTIEEAEFFNIINDIKKDYSIDTNRLYIAGTCSGGGEAIKLAARFPDRIAGLALIAPEVIFPNESKNSAVPLIKNITYTPIIDIHSAIDLHIDVRRSELLNKIAKELKFPNFTYVRLPNEYPKYNMDEFFDDGLEYCTKYTLNKSPKEIDFTTPHIIYNKSFWVTLDEINSPDTAHIYARIKGNTLTIQKENVVRYSINLSTLPFNHNKTLKIKDNGKVVFDGMAKGNQLELGLKPNRTIKNIQIAGPLAHVFTQKFIVVMGTIGNKTENAKLKALADTLNSYWYKRYFVSCRIKKDTEINEKDIAGAHLVLLGNFNSNSILKKLQGKLPLTITNTDIQISKKTTQGEKLCFYMIHPNPLNKNKYVAIIGYNNPEYISLGSERGDFNDVSDYGWFDYKVWEPANNNNGLESGYFNQYWETGN